MDPRRQMWTHESSTWAMIGGGWGGGWKGGKARGRRAAPDGAENKDHVSCYGRTTVRGPAPGHRAQGARPSSTRAHPRTRKKLARTARCRTGTGSATARAPPLRQPPLQAKRPPAHLQCRSLPWSRPRVLWPLSVCGLASGPVPFSRRNWDRHPYGTNCLKEIILYEN
jgi:hypothetical protein